MSLETTHVSFANTDSTSGTVHDAPSNYVTTTTSNKSMNICEVTSSKISENTVSKLMTEPETPLLVPITSGVKNCVEPSKVDETQRINSLLSSGDSVANNDFGIKRGKGMV